MPTSETVTSPLAEEVEPFVTHLYALPDVAGNGRQPARGWTYCGLRVRDDQHAQMHIGHKQRSPRFRDDPGFACPVCGAPICGACIQAWRRG